MEKKIISTKQIARYPIYLKHLKDLKAEGLEIVPSPIIAELMNSSEEQVRKDFQAISTSPGKPRYGRNIDDLINDLEVFLGYNKLKKALIIGVGHLGGAYMNYRGFASFGLNIVCGFDSNIEKTKEKINDKFVYPMDLLEKVIKEEKIEIAILTVPKDYALDISKRLVNAGIKGIWNFTSVDLDELKEKVAIENVNLASSFALLSHKINSLK
ncbi:MAG: redox-sensing transcriptional repressor Rex [Gammaproteobacteria bacterium]|nr:redox-sensing transcriptional repressor Rex [Gammaproteobacteria bacterium]